MGRQIDCDIDSLHWYAIKVPNRSEFRVQQFLQQHEIECYLPIVHILKGEKRQIKPAIPCLIFVKTTNDKMLSLQQEYGSDKMFIYFERPTRKLLVVPDAQMITFMLVTSIHDTGLEYIDTEIVVKKRGEKVRVTGGVFEGAEGIIVRIKNSKRLIVSIEGVTAVATTYIPNCFLEKIE